MYLPRTSGSTRRLAYSALVLSLSIVTLIFVAKMNTLTATASGNDDGKAADAQKAVSAPAATFAANAGTLGAIPDSDVTSPVCQNNSTTFRDVTFTVSGVSGPIQSVAVNFNASHTFLQDLEVTLTAPTAQSLLLFSATGTTSTVANSCGGSSADLLSANTYTFADSASANWWTTALAGTPVPTSTNRTVVTGIGGTTNPPATTSLNTAFAAATANGTWTLRFRDRGSGDTGSVTAANLTITTAAANVQHVLDFNGDGKTDYSVVRNTGGGPTGQITWFNCFNGIAEPACWQFADWGIATDFFVPADYDGDLKTDIAVWRPGASGTAAFYILQSQTSTVRTDVFGQTGDDPTVIADYTGDGKADPAVYRGGANAGDQSFWYYRASSGPFNGSIVYEQWGQNGDFPGPGDYDGDGKSDFMVQRNAGGGQAIFWLRTNTTNTISNYIFGTPTDVIVPGDYDGDGKTDIATIRGSGGSILWFYRSSISGNLVWVGPFGNSATDFPVQGDYDGDGKTDLAVWRPSADTSANYFHVLGSTSGYKFFEWGQNGDYPPANYNSH